MKTSYALALGAVLLVGGGYGGWRVFAGQPKQEQTAQPPSVPVTTAESRAADVPVYLRGIGTVQALNAVEVHPQVGGVLLDVPVREGQEVKQGDTLAVIDPRPYKAALDKAQAQRQQDQAQLENAQADFKRYSSLARSDFASRQQVETQQSSVARLQGVIAADDAAIEDAQLNLGFCVLHAPMDGRVGLRRVDPGNLIQANSSGPGILSVVQVRPIAVLFTLPEGDLPRVRQASAQGELPVLADSSDGRDELARGTLLTADNAVSASSGTIQFKATFANADDRLTPGQFVSTRLLIDTLHGVTVPHEAVQHGQQGLYVFTVKPDKTADRRDIQLGYDDGKMAVIGKGIEAGEQVIVSGQTRVGAGTHVSPQEQTQNAKAEGGQSQGTPSENAQPRSAQR
jgi:multidrug efflux system membrane fusion protein